MQLSPANLKELRMVFSRRKKKPMVPAGIRSTTPASGATAPQRLPSLLAGKRKANEFPSSGDSSEPAIRRPAPDAVSASLPVNASEVTGEHAASSACTSCPPRQGRRTRLSWPAAWSPPWPVEEGDLDYWRNGGSRLGNTSPRTTCLHPSPRANCSAEGPACWAFGAIWWPVVEFLGARCGACFASAVFVSFHFTQPR